MHRFGNYHHTTLVQPAEHYLAYRASVFCGHGFQYRVVPNVILPLGKRCPRLMLYSFLGKEGIGSLLLEKRVRLKLVHSGLYLVVQEKVLQPLARKARNAYGTYAALLVKPLRGTPGGIIIAVWLVQI